MPLARVPGEHDYIVQVLSSLHIAQVIADLARAGDSPPALLELTGPAGGRWALGEGPPAATIQADAVDYQRARSGRNDHPDLQVNGDPATAAAATTARVVF